MTSAFIAEFAETKTRVRTLAFWMNGQFIQNQEWELEGTPCEDVVRGNLCHHPSGVWKLFPKEEGVESYLGVPLTNNDGDVLGHLAIFDNREMPPEPRLLFIFKIFAARAAAELSRIRIVEQLRLSEERFRDLFDEAPIAYVHEDVESRFIRANRAAMNILGITPEQARLQAQNLYLQEEIKSVHNFEEIVGQSAAIQSVLNNVCRVAATDASVLIQGESGTGKELIARAIHSASKRRSNPLIKINCAVLPAGLVESELFGHEKGAFTGAIAKRIGRFELADGGTIFLDEIGEIPLEVQVKLLRVLQEREFDRVGGKTPIKVDVRVIAATNRNLLQAVAEKTFREDLFYRLNVFSLITPPLRERAEDISLLVHFLLEKFAARIGKWINGISALSVQRLQSYQWPGNISELENVIERAIILSDSTIIEIDPEMLPGSTEPAVSAVNPKNAATLETIERQHILTVLEQTNWVIEGLSGAAHILDLHPSTLRYRVKKLGVSKGRHHI